MAVLLCNSICFFTNDMSKDAYEKGKTKIRHIIETVGAFHHVGKAIALGVWHMIFTPH